MKFQLVNLKIEEVQEVRTCPQLLKFSPVTSKFPNPIKFHYIYIVQDKFTRLTIKPFFYLTIIFCHFLSALLVRQRISLGQQPTRAAQLRR